MAWHPDRDVLDDGIDDDPLIGFSEPFYDDREPLEPPVPDDLFPLADLDEGDPA